MLCYSTDFFMGYQIQFNVTVSHQWWSAKDTNSFKLFDFCLVICNIHYYNWSIEIRRTYEKEKIHKILKTFLSPQQKNHNWVTIIYFGNSVQLFIFLRLYFFHTGDWYMLGSERPPWRKWGNYRYIISKIPQKSQNIFKEQKNISLYLQKIIHIFISYVKKLIYCFWDVFLHYYFCMSIFCIWPGLCNRLYNH